MQRSACKGTMKVTHGEKVPCIVTQFNQATGLPGYLGGFPSSRLLPSICSRTLTRSAGLATNCPMAPAHSPDKDAFLHDKTLQSVNSASDHFKLGEGGKKLLLQI